MSNGLPLSEKQGVGSSILPLATINIGLFSLHNQTFKNCDQTVTRSLFNFDLFTAHCDLEPVSNERKIKLNKLYLAQVKWFALT